MELNIKNIKEIEDMNDFPFLSIFINTIGNGKMVFSNMSINESNTILNSYENNKILKINSEYFNVSNITSLKIADPRKEGKTFAQIVDEKTKEVSERINNGTIK